MQVPGIAENDNKIVEEFEKGYMLERQALKAGQGFSLKTPGTIKFK